MPEALDQQVGLAHVYASALFALAQETNRVEEVRQELEELVKLLNLEPSFRNFMESSALDDDHRAAGLEKMFRGKLSDNVLNTLLVMNNNGRSGLLAALLSSYAQLQREAANEIEALAISALPLEEADRRRVEETAAQISGKRPLMTFRVDPSLLGGLILRIGDWCYDNSVRRQLEAAQRRLMERSERGLEVGVS